MKNKYYRQPGKINFGGIVSFALLMSAVCIMFFLVGAAADVKLKNVFSALLVTVCISIVCGFLSSRFVKTFKVRNTTSAVLCCVIAAVVGEAFEYLIFGGFAENISGGKVVQLAAALVEFIMPVIFMVIKAAEKSRLPFIESENKWAVFSDMERTYRFCRLPKKDQLIKTKLEKNPGWILKYAAKPGETPENYVAVKMWHNESKTENYITLTRYYRDKNGKEKSRVIVKYLKTDRAFVQAIQERFEPLRFSAESYMKQKDRRI